MRAALGPRRARSPRRRRLEPLLGGHSQGGHASLYTGELAASHAPDLKLVGVAAAAAATYLIELFDADKSSPAEITKQLASSSASKARE